MDRLASNDNQLLDWAPQLDRLREETAVAWLSGRFDPWALVEAECWLDLIDAEITAHRALPQGRPEVVAGLKQLAAWRGELLRLIGRLKSLEDGHGGTSLARRKIAGADPRPREMAA